MEELSEVVIGNLKPYLKPYLKGSTESVRLGQVKPNSESVRGSQGLNVHHGELPNEAGAIWTVNWWLETESCVGIHTCFFSRELSHCSNPLDLVKPESTKSLLQVHCTSPREAAPLPGFSDVTLHSSSVFFSPRYTCQSSAGSRFSHCLLTSVAPISCLQGLLEPGAEAVLSSSSQAV